MEKPLSAREIANVEMTKTGEEDRNLPNPKIGEILRTMVSYRDKLMGFNGRSSNEWEEE